MEPLLDVRAHLAPVVKVGGGSSLLVEHLIERLTTSASSTFRKGQASRL